MYPSSSSSSSQGSMGPSGGLIRYDSAPGSFLSNAVVDSVGSQPHHSPRFFTHSDTTSDPDPLQRTSPYYLNDMSVGVGAGEFLTTRTPSLVRHSSSPAGFLNHLASSVSTAPSPNNNVTRGLIGANFNTKSINQDNGSSSSSGSRGITRLNSQLSFTRQETVVVLPHISEDERDDDDDNETGMEDNVDIRTRKPAADNSYNGTSNFGVGSSWEDSNTIVFSQPNNNKRSKNIIMNSSDHVNSMESQLQFGVTTQGGMEKLLNMNIPQDSVPCKIRANRGCATHPRSIAERERRMRISGKLKKLQELVPNMDKQTSYSDMLDLAVQHIKGLQTHVQKLQHDMEKCTCGCKGES